MKPAVSVIIVTRNRAASLAATLESILHATPPQDLATEVLVVDNGSTDGTAALVKSIASPGMPVRYLYESRRGKSNGLNLAIGQAAGEIFLFTDDDIRVPANWIDAMCRPIVSGASDATAGSIRMAAHLRQNWMEQADYLMLACNEGIEEGAAEPNLVGANMGIAKRVFQIIAGFDPEIGPGISSGGEETLLAFQMRVARLKIARVTSAVVEHHFDPLRLTRQSLRQNAAGGAISDFYIAHHWSQAPVRNPLYRALRSAARLQYHRLRRWRQWWSHPAMPAWERLLLQEMHACLLHWKNRRTPRNYEKFGLAKLNGPSTASHLPDSHVRAGS